MTICIALADEHGVVVGADSQSTFADTITSLKERKWHLGGDGLSVAIAGPLEIQPFIHILASEHNDADDFCGALRERLKDEHGWNPSQDNDGAQPCWEMSLLLTDGLSVWEAGGRLYPRAITDREPAAIGCGWRMALGAMHASANIVSSYNTERIVMDGLNAAIHYDVNCGGEPWTARIDRKETIK